MRKPRYRWRFGVRDDLVGTWANASRIGPHKRARACSHQPQNRRPSEALLRREESGRRTQVIEATVGVKFTAVWPGKVPPQVNLFLPLYLAAPAAMRPISKTAIGPSHNLGTPQL